MISFSLPAVDDGNITYSNGRDSVVMGELRRALG